MPERFNRETYTSVCDRLALMDKDLAAVIDTHGYPPLWSRPNTFESLIHIILEQQVSLASALAALNKLRERLPEITPEGLLVLTDTELRACFFSRQKTMYTRSLATALIDGHIHLPAFEDMDEDEIRRQLTALKGIGNWTVDVYLMFVLQRPDVFPAGDLAADLALKKVKSLPRTCTKAEIIDIAVQWKPYRTVATMILWHHYLSSRKS